MATDFKNAIGVSGGVKPTTIDTPLDIRTRIETIADVESIPMPFVGMIFYVADEGEFYKVVSLKGKQITANIFKENMVVDQFEKLIPENEGVDLSHLATKEEIAAHAAECKAAHAALEARLDEIAAEIDDEEPYMADLKAYPTSKFLFACGHPVYVEGQEDGSVVVSYKWAEEMVGINLSAEDAAKTYIVGGYGHDNHNSKRSLPMTKVVARNAKIKGIVGGHYFEGIVGHTVIDAENCQMVAVMAGGWCGANVDGHTTRLNIVHETDVRLVNCTVSSTLFGGSQGNGVVDDSFMMLKDVKAGWVTVGGSNGLTNKGQIEIDGETEITVLQTTNRGLVRHAEVVMNDGHIGQLFVGGETEDSSVNGGIKEVELHLMGGIVDKLRLGTSEGQPFAGEVKGSMFQCEVKESEVDMAQFEVVEEPVVVEYAEKDHEHDQYLTEHQDISHLASKEDMEAVHTDMESRMDEKIAALAETTPQVMKSLEDLASAIEAHEDVYEAYVAQVGEALDGKAALDHEHDQYLTEHQSLEHLATKEQCQAAHEDLEARLEAEIARAKAREDEIAAEVAEQEPYVADLAAYPTSRFLFACGQPVHVEGQEDGSVVVSYGQKSIVLSSEDAPKTYIVGGYGPDNYDCKRSLPMTKVVARDAKIKGIVGGHYFEGIVGHAHIDAENCQMSSIIAGGWCGASFEGQVARLNVVHEASVRLEGCTVSSTLYGGPQGEGIVDDVFMFLKDVKAGWVTVGGSNGTTNKGQVEIDGETEIKVLQSTNRGVVRKAEMVMNGGHVEQFFVGGETEDKTVTGVIEDVEVHLMGGVVDKFRMGTSAGQPLEGAVKGSMFRAEIKESEVDMAQFEVVEEPVVVEYAEKDHEHEQYLTEHQSVEHLATKEEVSAHAAECEAAHAEMEARVEVLETINLETKPYIDKNGMLVLCGCPAVARGVGEEVYVSVRFFNNEEDKFVFTKDEFAKLRICMGYGAEGIGTKRNIVETTLELYDIDKVFIIDGGSQVTGEIGTVNIIAERCNYIDGIQGARAMNGGERNIVHNFNVHVKDCTLIDTLFGGGNGYSVVWNNHIEVEGDTTINILIAGGSNGYTNKGDVIVEGGHIKLMHAVNRGIVNHARMVVNGGQVDHMYMGGDATMSDAGTVHHSEVHLMGGQVSKLEMGVNVDKVSGQLMDCVVVEGDASMLEKVERPVDEVAELRAQVEALMARVAELENR